MTVADSRVRGIGRSLLVIPVSLLLLVTLGVGSAWAHGGEETDEASVLVRQAIELISSSPDELGEIQERVQAAAQAPDVSGVDVALVEQADEMLTSDDDLGEVRALLERSIVATTNDSSAAGDEPGSAEGDATPNESSAEDGTDDAATGADPGSTALTEPLDTRPELDVPGWLPIGGSILVGLVGLWLALRFGPVRGRAGATR